MKVEGVAMMSFGLSVLRSQPLPEPVGMGLFPVSHNTQHTQHTAHNRQRERERVRVREREREQRHFELS